eukprot:6914460-Pyramimonas_sp.AAC.1
MPVTFLLAVVALRYLHELLAVCITGPCSSIFWLTSSSAATRPSISTLAATAALAGTAAGTSAVVLAVLLGRPLQ